MEFRGHAALTCSTTKGQTAFGCVMVCAAEIQYRGKNIVVFDIYRSVDRFRAEDTWSNLYIIVDFHEIHLAYVALFVTGRHFRFLRSFVT